MLKDYIEETNERTVVNNQLPVLTASKNGVFLQDEYFKKQVASKDNTGYKIVHKGDFTYRAMSDTGYFYPNRLDCAEIGIVSPAYPVFRITKSNLLDSSYLKYYFKSNRFQFSISKYVQGSTRTSVKYHQLASTEIDLPDMEEQRKVVSLLDRTERIITFYNKQLSLLDNLVKSRFVEVFGDMADPKCKWNKCKLVEVCKDSDDIKCGPFGTQLGKDEYTSSGVAVWEIPQINSNFETHPTHFVTAEKANTLASYSIQPGDIAMSRKGNVGRCAVFPHEFENGIIHSDVLRIRVDDSKIDPEFLMRQLHYSGDIERQIELVSSGAIMAGINVTKLKNIFVFVPPKALQKVFVAFVHEVNKSKLAQVIYLR